MKTIVSTFRAALVGLLLSSLGVNRLQAQSEQKELRLSVGNVREISVAFPIRRINPGNPDVIQVLGLPGSDKVTVTCRKEGQSELQLVGDGNASETFRITVGPATPSIEAYLTDIRKDLERMPQIKARISAGRDKIVLMGTLHDPDDLTYLKTTVLPAYKDIISSRVQFDLQDELKVKLIDQLRKGGFTVKESVGLADPGVLTLQSFNNMVVIAGSVYSNSEVERIQSIVLSHPWLRLRKSGEQVGEDACYAEIRVTVAPVLLELDVTFVGLTESESQTLGMNLAKAGLATLEAGGRAVGGTLRPLNPLNQDRGSGLVVSAGVDDTLKAIKAGGDGRYVYRGFLTFRNNAPEWKKLHDGGEIAYPTPGGNGTPGSIERIQYGLMLEVKGMLSNATNLSADVRLALKLPVAGASAPVRGPFYTPVGPDINTTIECPIGKTFIVGGTQKWVQGVSKLGTPILQDIPIMQFLFSERNKTGEKGQLLILLSPHIARAPEVSSPVVERVLDTEVRANQPMSLFKSNSKPAVPTTQGAEGKANRPGLSPRERAGK